MTPLQYAAIQALAGAAALSVLFFDKRGRTHKPIFALLAYLMFVQMAALVLAALFRLDGLIVWLLIFSLAVHTGNILLARGNVGKIQQKPQWTVRTFYRQPKAKPKPSPSPKPHIQLKPNQEQS